MEKDSNKENAKVLSIASKSMPLWEVLATMQMESFRFGNKLGSY
jgi:hypothetical protein